MSDYWTEENAPEGASKPLSADRGGIEAHDICPIAPLDAQLGASQKKTTPDGLTEALFAQPEISARNREKYGAGAPLKLYALVDAAKMLGLREVLMETDLNHACLFKGEAQEELADVAPYLVELKDGESFTRNLFTQTDADWHLWGADIGIFMRSYASLEVLRDHLRKFTRVQDLTEKWFFFRFWDGPYLDEVLRSSEQAMNSGFLNEIHSLGYIHQTMTNDWCFRVLRNDMPDSSARKCFVLNAQMEQAMTRVSYRLRAEKAAVELDIPAPELKDFVSLAQRHYTFGYDDDQKIGISHHLFKKIPQDQQAAVWAVLKKADDSLGFTHHRIREHFGIEE